VRSITSTDYCPPIRRLGFQLTSPVDLPRELAGWFRAALPAREPGLLLLETLLAGLHRHGSVSGALAVFATACEDHAIGPLTPEPPVARGAGTARGGGEMGRRKVTRIYHPANVHVHADWR
jgi:hypothetical protein